MKALLGTIWETEYIGDNISDLYITNNFEQIYGMIKLGEIDRLCIVLGGWNSTAKNDDGYYLANKIHETHPALPILIIQGRHFEWSVKARRHIWPPIKNKNEIYIKIEDYGFEVMDQIVVDFYNGTLEIYDIPKRAELGFDTTYGEYPFPDEPLHDLTSFSS